ncbi:MAG: SDR family oxidoreductase [Planctomycetaceae bacterium]|jgi:enoyl-[acyl-carrier protein] reductase III|nr:SDR family oxidoreductase [Planctomycetaceae bacterium]
MNIDLTNKVALVTGASRGIGRATAIRLAEAGADVIVNYVTSRNAAEEVANEINQLGRQAWIVKGDVSEKEDVEMMFDFVRNTIGRLNILVSNAATGGFRPLLIASNKNFDAAFHTNVLALMYLVQSAMPLLEKGQTRGKVITISSHGAIAGLPMYGLVGASKAALESLVRHLTLEIGDRGVNINVVRAGLVATDSSRRLPNAEKLFNDQISSTQVGERILLPEDVANTILFLASPLSDMIQGETITIDGGAAIRGA